MSALADLQHQLKLWHRRHDHDCPDCKGLRAAVAAVLALPAPKAEEPAALTPDPATQFFCRNCGHPWSSHGGHGCGASAFTGPCACKTPAPQSKERERCAACSGYGKRPVYSAGEEMVADFAACPACRGTGNATKGDK